jgi:hypothetical protein
VGVEERIVLAWKFLTVGRSMGLMLLLLLSIDLSLIVLMIVRVHNERISSILNSGDISTIVQYKIVKIRKSKQFMFKRKAKSDSELIVEIIQA